MKVLLAMVALLNFPARYRAPPSLLSAVLLISMLLFTGSDPPLPDTYRAPPLYSDVLLMKVALLIIINCPPDIYIYSRTSRVTWGVIYECTFTNY